MVDGVAASALSLLIPRKISFGRIIHEPWHGGDGGGMLDNSESGRNDGQNGDEVNLQRFTPMVW